MALQEVEKYVTEKCSKAPRKLPDNRPNNGFRNTKDAFAEQKRRRKPNAILKQSINSRILFFKRKIFASI